MLEFHFRRPNLSLVWQTSSSGWFAEESFIKPYGHPMLEDFALATDDRMLFVVRERLNGLSLPQQNLPPTKIEYVQPAKFDTVLEDVKEWPLDFIAIVLFCQDNDSKIIIQSGSWGKAPVYVLEKDDSLWGHWDPVKLYPYTQSISPNPILTAHFLVNFDSPYSRKTLVPDVQLLTERSTTYWGNEQGENLNLRIEYPSAMSTPRPRVLKSGANVLSMFQEILDSSMERWLLQEVPFVSTELSGGLDSGIVSAVLSSLSSKPIYTYGIVLLDSMGKAQQERRQELIKLFGFCDQTIEIRNHLPLTFESRRIWNQGVVPWDECYYEAVDQMLENASQKHSVLLFTGIGGDELFYPHWEELSDAEREVHRNDVSLARAEVPKFLSQYTCEAYYDTLNSLDRAPLSIIPTSALESIANGVTHYLRHGIWPVHPLCTPELIRFCRSLPREWRENRELERKLLIQMGCSRTVAYPQNTDDFSPAMEVSFKETVRPFIYRLFKDSRLADLGFIDGKQLLVSYSDYCESTCIEGSLPFYRVAIMELTLRSLEAKQGRLNR